MTVSLIRPSAIAAQNEYEIELKDLSTSKIKIKHQHKPQIAPPVSVEIDLKDLRNIAPPKSAKPPQQKRQNRTTTAKITKGIESEVESIYVVRPGEHLFKILMKRYGESNESAERMIPYLMRINGITSPTGLKVGQRLRIPLPYRGIKPYFPPPESDMPSHLITPAADQTAATSVQKKSAESPVLMKNINFITAPPCSLAHDILEGMGLLAASQIEIRGLETVSAVYAGLTVVIACGLSSAEEYTLQRLLSHSGNQLLFFGADASEARVIEKMSNYLGLAFHKDDLGSENLPLSYIFEPFGTWSAGLQLNILPAETAIPAKLTTESYKK